MNRKKVISTFRDENPEMTTKRISNTILQSFCKEGNKDVCARTRCIVDEDGATISTKENDERFDLTTEISKFMDVDTAPGGGVLYNNKRISVTTMAMLDNDYPSWRDRTSGTPKKWYKRGKWLCLDRPIDSNAEDIKVYCVLRPDDFDADTKTPFNELEYLEPYHYVLVKYLQWKAKEKVGKQGEGAKAKGEYETYIAYMIKMIGAVRHGPIKFIPA